MTARERLIKGYVALVIDGKLTIDKVPASLREDVEKEVKKLKA